MIPPSLDDNPASDSPQDRREVPRHEPRERRAWIGWRGGERARLAVAILVDISCGGIAAVVATPDAPDVGEPVMLHLEPGPASIARAAVAGVESICPGLWRTADLPDGCPPEMVQMATLGPEAYHAMLN